MAAEGPRGSEGEDAYPGDRAHHPERFRHGEPTARAVALGPGVQAEDVLTAAQLGLLEAPQGLGM